MSPEQAGLADRSGLRQVPDVRTGVYGLGVLLYELLAGSPPLTWPAGQTLSAIYFLIREKRPLKPSDYWKNSLKDQQKAADQRSGSSAGIARKLRGDLDWITLKALEKELGRRYPSPEHLVAELRRFSQKRPVKAGPPSLSYRLGKFIIRNKWMMLTGVGIIFLTLAFAAAMLAQHQSIVRQRDLAQRERDKATLEAATARSVTGFLTGLFETSNPFSVTRETRGEAVTAKEILDKGVAKIKKELDDQPEIQARLLTTIGSVYPGLGLYREAEPPLKRALSLRREHLTPEHPDLAESLAQMGLLSFEMGDLAEAESLFRDALDLRQRIFEVGHPRIAGSTNQLANLLREKGAYGEAETLFRKTLMARRLLAGENHLSVAETLNELAILFAEQGKFALAEVHHRRALAINRRLLGEDHPIVATDLNNLALVLQNMGGFTEAERLYRQSLAIRERVLDEDHPDIATSMNNLGLLFHIRGKYVEAEPLYRKALSLRRELPNPTTR